MNDDLRHFNHKLHIQIIIVMTAEELKLRLKSFAYRCVNVCEFLPKKRIGKIIEDQLLRSSFSVAANYRAACRAQ